MQSPKKGTVKKTVKKEPQSKRKTKTGYAPNQNVAKYDDKTRTARFTTTNKKGKISDIETISDNAFKEYSADPSGKVSYAVATKGEVPQRRPDYKKSVDTTGYAAGKKEFTVNSIMRKPGELTKTKSTKITRKEVKPLLDRMKAKASKMKKGGMIRTKKK
jgi:hypothetical protein